jgi:glycosyltransferase involved in cell wall biosynthesis
MRIAQVAPLYESVPPKLYGGTELIVSYLTEGLVSCGHDVTLFASGDSLTRARLEAVCPRALRLNRDSVDHLAHHILMLEAVAEQQEQFDIIHFHIDYLHFPLTRAMQWTSLTTLHGRLDVPDLVPLYKTFSEMPLCSVSNAQRGPIPAANWQGTIYHGLPPEHYEFSAKSEGYLAFLGRTSPEKGLDQAIEIAKRSGMKLKIGAKIDPSDMSYFDNRIKPLLGGAGVQFLGEVGSREKVELLGGAAALLFPISWPEPFGIVMIEAMACGVPVIAYPLGSVPEIVEHGLTGFVVADADRAVEAVKEIDSIDRAVCRRRFEQRFSASQMTRRYLRMYDSLVRRSSTVVSESRGVSLA